MKTRALLSVLAVLAVVLVLGFSLCAFAEEPTAAAAAATLAQTATQAAPAVAAAMPALPAIPALPASHDALSIIFFVIACLGWLVAAASELLPFLPGKAQGFLHGFLSGSRTVTGDAAQGTITINVNDLVAIARGGRIVEATPSTPTTPSTPSTETGA